MKLLFVIDNLGSGGAQRQMVNLGRGLQKRGHSVEFFVYYPADHYRHLLDQVGIPVHLHPKESRFSLAPLCALRRLVSRGKFDLVLSFLDTPNFYAEIAMLGCKDTRLVVSERFMYTSEKLPLSTWILQSLHRLADSITVNSHHQRTKMEQLFPWMTPKLRTIYNGVDLERFTPDQKLENSIIKSHSLVAISTIVEKKNMLGLAKSLTICRDKYNLKPIIRWAGKQDHSKVGQKAFEETADFLHANELEDQWEWLGERFNIPELLRQHDALIHPSFYEGLPNVVCEALACGRPVLVSNVCDHSILVEDGVSGFLFDPHSPESIAEAIAKFYGTSHEQRQSMGESARIYAEKNLSIDSFVNNYEKLFLSLMGIV
jgi:glycosyltransferase involved in cell wall biosynthesis